jgi:uncharacterized tellurite resistance protein B-like protein
MALAQLKLLITLARVDREVVDKERKYITNIGLANGLSDAEIATLFKKDHRTIIPDNLTKDQRFDYIFSLVQLMKIDERLYQDEIRYCAKIASRLGYDQIVLFDLMLYVHSVMGANELEALKQLTAKYLNKR